MNQSTAVPAGAPQPLQFKADSSAGSGVVTALLVTVLLLAATTAGLAFAKKRGWLKRWTVQPAGKPGALAIVERLRISPRTVVFRVQDGDRQFVVVESTANVVTRDA